MADTLDNAESAPASSLRVTAARLLHVSSNPPTDQLTTLRTTFGLTTAAEEIVPRLTQAGHQAAVPVLVEVFEAEAEARRSACP